MTRCSDYEIEISALLDGEGDPSIALELLGHVGACRSCSAFVQNLRTVQATIDEAYAIEMPSTDRAPQIEPKRPSARVPRWAWGLAATLVASLGLSSIVNYAPSDLAEGALEDREIVIRLEEDKGGMSQDRFMELVTELLQADRIYRDHMYSVLDAVREGEVPNEFSFVGGMRENRGSEGENRVRSTSTLALD